MFLTKPDLTAGARPILSPDETLLCVQDGVGLYEGKYKVASCQKGQAYLTSHRAYYIDEADARANSWAVDLKNVERHEYQAGFLKSSAKVTLFPKPLKRGFGSLHRPGGSQSPQVQRLISSSSPGSRSPSPFRSSNASVAPSPQPLVTGTWVCPICSFSNPVPSNFDPTIATESFPLPPCLACGIQPPFSLVLKAAVAANAKRIPAAAAAAPAIDGPGVVPTGDGLTRNSGTQSDHRDSITCPRCTFHNHPSLSVCEICGAPLPTSGPARWHPREGLLGRSQSPGPEISGLNLEDDHELTMVKFSFRNGGDKVFYERLKNAMVQRKWLLQNAPPIPQAQQDRTPTPVGGVSPVPTPEPRPTGVGIAGLEQRGLQTRRNNEAVLGNAFGDLEALMASAKDVVALAERFATESGAGTGAAGSSNPLLSHSAAALGMVTTKDLLGDNSNSLYLSELARNLAEYATDDRRGVLHGHGGIMSLVDLWAIYNRSQNGVELVSPSDFHNAAEAWDRLGLPVKLRRFRSGLLVVQRRDMTDDRTVGQLKDWLDTLRAIPPEEATAWDWPQYGCGVTAQQAATRFGWSLGVATEELEMAEERGVLCREESVEGLKFWINSFIDKDDE